MENKKWYEVDFTEELCVIAIVIIAVTSLLTMTDASNAISATIGGLVGYLTRTKKNGH